MIDFYELDSDNYVTQYSITFEPLFENIITLRIRGYFEEERYRLINKTTKKLEFEGDYFEINKYINKLGFSTQKEFEKEYNVENYLYDKYRDWASCISNIQSLFKIKNNKKN